MYENKLFTLLNRLNRREMSLFQKHLSGPSTREDVPTQVFSHIRKYHPDFTDKTDLDPLTVHQYLFASEPYNRDKILNAYSDIYLRLRDYLMIQKLKTGTEFRYLWISILKERGLEHAAGNEAQQLRREVEALPKKEVSDYLKGIEAHYYFAYLADQDRTKPDEKALQGFAEDLDTYYAICRLKVSCEMINLKRQHPKQYSFDTSLGEALQSEKYPDIQHPLLLCYRKIYMLLQTGEEVHFEAVEALLSQYAHQIGPLDLHTIISYLHNYASSRLPAGADKFQKKVHWLNNIALQYDLFSRKGAMSPSQFNNIIFVACALKDFAWAERFILKQGQFLDDDIREVTIELAKATFYMEQKHLKQVLDCLQNTYFKDPLHRMRASTLTLMCHYEKKSEYEFVESLCKNFEGYLYRQKEKYPRPASGFLNFTRIFRMLLDGKESREQIQKVIEQTGNVMSRAWLLEQANLYKPIYAAR
jgi:hypothetical protein